MRAWLRALADPRTYDLRHNRWTWLGFAWGLPVPVLSIGLDLWFGGGGGVWSAIIRHPIHFFFLAHPLLFAAAFGAVGTMMRDKDELAARDPLTGLLNRRMVLDELHRLVARSARSGEPFTVVMFDMDRFKAVNEKLGHPAGDLVLRGAAAALAGSIRAGDVLGRYGGDEFLLLLPNGLDELADLVDRASHAVRERSGVSVSAGVARWPEDGATADELIRRADVALSMAKRHRRAAPVRI